MSKTPRTDEHLKVKFENGHFVIVGSDFARQLESELVKTRADMENLQSDCKKKTTLYCDAIIALELEGTLKDALINQMQLVLKNAEQFIENGIELGYIYMPDPETPDAAHKMLPQIKAALSTAERMKK